MTTDRTHIEGRPIPPVLVELRDRIDHMTRVITDLNGVDRAQALELVEEIRTIPKLLSHLHDLVMLLAKTSTPGRESLSHREIADQLGLRGHRGIQNEVYRAARRWPGGLEQVARAQPTTTRRKQEQ